MDPKLVKDQARDAWSDGRSLGANPYPENTPEHEVWEEEWLDMEFYYGGRE